MVARFLLELSEFLYYSTIEADIERETTRWVLICMLS